MGCRSWPGRIFGGGGDGGSQRIGFLSWVFKQAIAFIITINNLEIKCNVIFYNLFELWFVCWRILYLIIYILVLVVVSQHWLLKYVRTVEPEDEKQWWNIYWKLCRAREWKVIENPKDPSYGRDARRGAIDQSKDWWPRKASICRIPRLNLVQSNIESSRFVIL